MSKDLRIPEPVLVEAVSVQRDYIRVDLGFDTFVDDDSRIRTYV
jgi:hypothetical protein